MSNESSSHEETPLLPVESGSVGSSSITEVPSGDVSISSKEIPSRSPPSSSSLVNKGRLLLLLVAFLYGSLSVSLRMVYARPGPPAASILSATRGWMTVLCLLPVIAVSSCRSRASPSPDPPSYSRASFYGFALELAIFNFGTQGLLNIGLLTTESARSAFFTQLSVVITPILAATIGMCRKKAVVVECRVWIACFLALFGLYVLSSSSSSSGQQVDDGDGDGSVVADTDELSDSSLEGLSWASVALTVSSISHLLSFGDWCCVGSAFSWSYYIYRLSDWGDRYDEAQTMFAKNIFMAILYTLWTVTSYYWTTVTTATTISTAASEGDSINDSDSDIGGFYMWEGWRDPIALSILFYTALSSGALSDILQQKAQAHVPAAESNVILSLEPVFAAVLGLALLAEIPSLRECLGGAFIVIASVIASM